MQTAEQLCEHFEECRLLSYPDTGGIWTIGWGHTGKDVYPSLLWTQEQADDALTHDLLAARVLTRQYSPRLTGTAFEAITDFVFNLGIERYRSSALKQCIDNSDMAGARVQILRWDHGRNRDGQLVQLPGLTARRRAECELLK